MAATISASERLARMRPVCTMRVSGVGLPEQTLMAPWMLPCEIWDRSRASSLSLSMTALRRTTARSVMMDTVIIEKSEDGPHSPPAFVEGIGQ